MPIYKGEKYKKFVNDINFLSLEMVSTKYCRCKIVKDITDFYKNKTREDGFQPEFSQCKYEIYLLSKE
jgi:hypothetical protein